MIRTYDIQLVENFVPNLLLPFKLHKIWPIDSKENHKNCCFSCQILRLKCTKFDFDWGAAPDPAGGAYSTPPAGFKGPTSKRREGGAEGGERRDDGSSGDGSEREREEVSRPLNFGPPSHKFLALPLRLRSVRWLLKY